MWGYTIFPLISSLLLVLFVIFIPSSSGQVICSSIGSPKNYSELMNISLNNENQGFLMVGFCEGLYGPNDLIAVLSEISCFGEGGNFTSLRRGMGGMTKKCRIALGKTLCFLNLPKYRSAASFGIPCTNEQADPSNPSPFNLTQYISRECAELGDSLVSRGVLSGFAALDKNLMEISFLRTSCRVVDGGEFEKPEDSYPNWKADVWDCPEGLSKFNNEDLDNPSNVGCTLPCPGPFFTNSELSIINNITEIISPISFIASLLTVIRWIFRPGKMKFPAVMIWHLSICLCLLHVASLISWGRQKEVWCKNSYQPNTQKNLSCGFQGFITSFVPKAAVNWWLAIVVHLYIILVHHQKHIPIRSFWFFTPYFIPIPSLVISFYLNKIEYVLGSTWCFVSADDDGAWQYGLFFFEIVLALMFSTTISIRIILFVLNNKKGQKSQMKLFTLKVIALTIYFFLVVILMIYSRLDGSIREDEMQDSFVNWITCLFLKYSSVPEKYENGKLVAYPDYSSCPLPIIPSFFITLLLIIVYSTAGLLITCLFGFNGLSCSNKPPTDQSIAFQPTKFQPKISFFAVLLESLMPSRKMEMVIEQEEYSASISNLPASKLVLANSVIVNENVIDKENLNNNSDTNNKAISEIPRTRFDSLGVKISGSEVMFSNSRQCLVYDYIILGTGASGGFAASAFVQQGIEKGQLCMITKENFPPYEHLVGAEQLQVSSLPNSLLELDLFKTSREWLIHNSIDIFLDTTITDIDTEKKLLTSKAGTLFSASKALIIATGTTSIKIPLLRPSVTTGNSGTATTNASPKLPNHSISHVASNNEMQLMSSRKNSLDITKPTPRWKVTEGIFGLHYLRTINDVKSLIQCLNELARRSGPQNSQCVVIGGNCVAMEYAAAIRMRGFQVKMVFESDCLIQDLFSPEISSKFEEYFAQKGIDIIKKHTCDGIVIEQNKVVGCRLSNGKVLKCALAIVSIGSKPNSSMFEGKLTLQIHTMKPGVCVDGSLQTSSPGIYAIGGVSSMLFFSLCKSKLEDTEHSKRTADHVVSVIMHKHRNPFEYFPSMSCSMFGLNWYFFGDSAGNQCTLVGDLASKLIVLWIWQARIQGALITNGTVSDIQKLKLATAEQKLLNLVQVKKIVNSDDLLKLL